MTGTTLRPTPEQQKRLAQGHTRAGQDAPHWPVYVWYAAGGLRSAAHDMISFGEACLGHNEVNGTPVSAELTAATQLTQKPIFTMPNGKKRAMAWVNDVRGGDPVIPKKRRNGRIRQWDRRLSQQRRSHLHRDEPGRSSACRKGG